MADNALLVVAMARLEQSAAAAWAVPALRICFYASYVLLAPVAGPLADRWPKSRLMTGVNALKLLGCIALAAGTSPLLIFFAIGLGAAAYAPARYGILPELTSGRALMRANAAMEIVTIVAILSGLALGAWLVDAHAGNAAVSLLALLYGAAALVIGTAPAVPAPTPSGPRTMPRFWTALAILLRDADARTSLAMTSLFWSTAAVLQFIMIEWARRVLGLSLAAASMLPAVLAVGMVGGALAAGRWVHASRFKSLLPIGILLGAGVLLMPVISHLWVACALLIAVGACAGVLLVPMNALLQKRGASLMAPGLSVALQNFVENGVSLLFLAAYGLSLAGAVAPDSFTYLLGACVTLTAAWIAWRGQRVMSA